MAKREEHTAPEIVDFLRTSDELYGVQERLAARRAVERACRDRGLVVSDSELQEATDSLRQGLGIASAEKTFAWIKGRGLTLEDLESLVEYRVLLRKLMGDVYGPDALSARFKELTLRYSQVCLSLILVDNEEQARELLAKIVGGESSFEEAARKFSLEVMSQKAGGVVGWVPLERLPAPLSRQLRASPGPGLILEPIRCEHGWYLAYKASVIDYPPLTSKIRDELLSSLLTEWLDSADLTRS